MNHKPLNLSPGILYYVPYYRRDHTPENLQWVLENVILTPQQRREVLSQLERVDQ